MISKVSYYKILYFFYATERVLGDFHGNSDLATRVPWLLRL
jgi:hypothetical protein